MALEIYIVCKSLLPRRNRLLRQLNGELREIYLNKLNYLACKFRMLSVLSFLEQQLSVEDIVDIYDFHTIFTNYYNLLYRIKRLSPVNLLIRSYISNFHSDYYLSIEKNKNLIYSLSKLGSVFLYKKPPFMTYYTQDLSFFNSKKFVFGLKKTQV